ncbi:hypothetical protein TWF970_011092 [Orbilia oligospora]|uniref:Uncharacterized protein n=1 Tax=Orbilia oligospora TaxID=2813651 RepID=A0A7C8RJL2_ORBOL|nr:hypothetical protein TWF970_011092 [Orbilia oligospora]
MGIEHGIAGRLRRAGGHENLAGFVGVESLSGRIERMDLIDLKGQYLETQTGSAGTLENCSRQRINITESTELEGKPEKRETQEAHILLKNRNQEPRPQTIQPAHAIKHEVPESFKSTDSDLDTDSENDELEVEKFNFLVLKAVENSESHNWEKAEEYWKATIKIWGTVRNHPGMEGFRIPSLKPHEEEELDEKWMPAYLAWSQLLQGKSKEALQTINFLSDEEVRDDTILHGVIEWTKASAYTQLGDLKEARRRCRKAVKLAREVNDLDLSRLSIELMVEILEMIEGPEGIELEFYKSLLPPDSEGASEEVLKGTDEPD